VQRRARCHPGASREPATVSAALDSRFRGNDTRVRDIHLELLAALEAERGDRFWVLGVT